jgi:hypothetical protein
VQITAPQAVDWTEIVKSMLDRTGLPHATPIVND